MEEYTTYDDNDSISDSVHIKMYEHIFDEK